MTPDRARRRPAAVLALVMVVAMAMAACGRDTASDDSGAGDGGGGEPLRVGIKYDQPLFGLETVDGLRGFDAEIARHVADELGRESIDFVEAVSANREAFLQDGTVDMVVATYTITEERDEVVDFAGPYFVASQDILVAAGNPLEMDGVSDLDSADVTTCTVAGSTSLQRLEEMAPDADVEATNTYSQCVDALVDGDADAVTTDDVILRGLAEQYGDEVMLVDNPFGDEAYGIGVPEGSDLRCRVNDILQGMYDDGTWQQVLERTVGTVVSSLPEPPEINDEGC